MREYETVVAETRENVGLVILNGRRGNSLNLQILTEMMDALLAFDQDDTVGAMVLSGKSKIFAPGADIAALSAATKEEILRVDPIRQFDRIMQVKKPVIAAVSGLALGGGFEIALSCDMIVASESAKFGLPEVNLGLIPGAGGTQRLTHTVGKAIAMEMILNNRILNAEEAYQLGLVNKIVPVDSFQKEAVTLAQQITSRSPLMIQSAKAMVNEAYENALTDGLAIERKAFYDLYGSHDQQEGLQAFLEKRQPEWKGS